MGLLDGYRRFCADYDVQLVVLSRDRADVLARLTDRIAQDYILFYSGEGYEDYEYHCTERVEVPRGLLGRSAAANFALRHVDNKIVFLLGDDVYDVQWYGSERPYYLDRDGFMALQINLVINALDLGVGLFGVNDVDIRKASPLFPFHTRSMITGLVGINRNVQPDQPIWFDERQRLKEDYDFCLQFLKRDRLVWKDLRYWVSHNMQTLRGGNMEFRTHEREEQEVQNLRDWWGSDMIRWNPGTKKRTKGQQTKHLRVVV